MPMAQVHSNGKVYNIDMRRRYYSTKEAAAKLGISTRRVRKLLQQGRIPGVKFGTVWLIYKPEYTRKGKGPNEK